MAHADTLLPVVRWSRDPADRAGTPLLVALHGRGSDERTFAELTPCLPVAATTAFVRAPIAEGDGYAWFENRGVGRPVAASIVAAARRLLAWLESAAEGHSSLHLLGFSGGMAMAGALLLVSPRTFTSAVLLSGTLPWDAGLPEEPGRLEGVRVSWGRDTADTVIPQDLVARTGAWLRGPSGADLTERTYEDLGHAISAGELADAHAFLTDAFAAGGRG